MFGLFGSDSRLYAVTEGVLYPLEEVKDEMFSKKMLGDGFAIKPNETVVRAPCDGIIQVLPDSKHAFGMKCDNGQEILVHIGIDTVMRNGKGFEAFVQVNERVRKGQKIISFDEALLKEGTYDMSVMVLLLNGSYKITRITKKMNQLVQAEEEIIRYRYVKNH